MHGRNLYVSGRHEESIEFIRQSLACVEEGPQEYLYVITKANCTNFYLSERCLFYCFLLQALLFWELLCKEEILSPTVQSKKEMKSFAVIKSQLQFCPNSRLVEYETCHSVCHFDHSTCTIVIWRVFYYLKHASLFAKLFCKWES